MLPSVHVPEPASLGELLELHDEDFVRAAYLLILGRAGDTEGRAFYVRRIRSGARREEIVVEMASSVEAAARETLLPDGLGEFFRAEEARRPGLAARILGRLLGPAQEPLAKQLRIVENLAFRILEGQKAQAETARMSALLSHQRADGAAEAGRYGEPAGRLAESPTHTVHGRAVFEMKKFLEAT
jgi:hypothetical protein